MDWQFFLMGLGLGVVFLLSWLIGYGTRPTRYQLRYGQVDPLFWFATIVNTLSFLGLVALVIYYFMRG